jgi:hypothetical protein
MAMNQPEIIQAVQDLINAPPYNGSVHDCYVAFCPNGSMGGAEVMEVLIAAQVTPRFMEGGYANAIIAKIGSNGTLSEAELDAAIASNKEA